MCLFLQRNKVNITANYENKMENFTFKSFLRKTPFWYNDGKYSDVVLYTGCKIVRNIKDYAYPNKIEKSRLISVNNRIENHLRSLLEKGEALAVNLDGLTENEILALQEKRIIPRLKLIERKYKKLYIFKDQKTFILSNFENHLTIFSFGAGLAIKASEKRVNKILGYFPDSLFQKSDDYNYLSSSLEFSGTGFKAYAYLTIPNIRLKSKLTRIIKSFKSNGIVFTRFFNLGSVSEDILVVTHRESFSQKIPVYINVMENLVKKVALLEREFESTEDDYKAACQIAEKIQTNDLNSHRDMIKLFFSLGTLSNNKLCHQNKLKAVQKEMKKGLLEYQQAHLSLKKQKILSVEEVDLYRKDFLIKIIKSFF